MYYLNLVFVSLIPVNSSFQIFMRLSATRRLSTEAHRLSMKLGKRTLLDKEQEVLASWRSTSGTAAQARLVFATQSSLDPSATVEVRERPVGGWRTVSLVGGATKSIYHGIYRVDMKGNVDPSAIVSDHLKSMAAMALVALESMGRSQKSVLRFLHLGLGAGTLARMLSYHVVDSQHIAVELDAGVAAALPIQSNICVTVGDALKYRRMTGEAPFDCILIDIFDAENLLPPELYSVDFLRTVRENFLDNSGVVVHNFHTGGVKLSKQLSDAEVAYSLVFDTSYRVESLDSRPTGGNSILLASTNPLTTQNLQDSAPHTEQRWNLPFDVLSRIKSGSVVKGS